MLKKFFIVCLKQAVNALLTNTAAWFIDPATFNWKNLAGWEHMLALAGSVVLIREGTVWLPVILKWSSTNSQPDDVLGQALEKAEVATKQAVVSTQKAASAVSGAKDTLTAENKD